MKKIALIGYGYWGPNLLRNLIDTKNCKVIYCCDLSKDNLKKAKNIYPPLVVTDDVNRVMKDPKVDGVIIATPTRTHFPLAEQALNAGKDVLIEKPFTMTVLEANTLLKLAENKKRIIMVDHTFLFNGAVMKIKNLIENDELGKILYIDSVRANLGLFQSDTNVIFDLASHDFSIFNFLLDSKPKYVRATGKSHFNTQEDVAYINAGYPKGVSAYTHVSWMSPLKVRRMLIIGSKKMVVYDDNEVAEKLRIYDKGVVMEETNEKMKEQIKINYRTGDVWMPKLDIIEPLGVLVETFVRAMNDREVPKSGGRFILDVMEALEASTKSVKTGRKVTL